MGSTTENIDCYHHHQQHHHSHHYHDDYRDNGHHHQQHHHHCSLLRDSPSENNDISGGSRRSACPLRMGISNNEDYYSNNNFSCDSNHPSICHCTSSSSSCAGDNNNTDDDSNDDQVRQIPAPSCRNHTDISCNFNKEINGNSNYISSPRKCRRRSSRGSSTILGSLSSPNSFRITSLSTLLRRPCVLYLFTLIVLLDLSDFNSVILISPVNVRTALSKDSMESNVMGMRYNTFLVNGAFDNKNGHLNGYGLTGETPILSMDSVFFHNSIGNTLTESSESSGEEEGENISEEVDDTPYDQDQEDSVEISRTVEPQMLKRLESKFLNLFGMEKRPHRQGSKKQIKVPKYLLDLYQKQTGSDLPTSNLNLPGRHTKTANTVRTFYHEPGTGSEPSYPWKGRENHIKFSLRSIPEDEKVTGAELRIPFVITVSSDNSVLVNSAPLVENSGYHPDNSKHGELKAVRILLHDITKPATSPSSTKPKELHLLEPISYPIDTKTVVLSKRRNGTSSFWLTFDVFPAVQRWMNNPKKNYGLVLEILGVTNEGLTVPQDIVVEKHNLRVKRDTREEQEHDDDDDEQDDKSVLSANSITTESSSSTTTSTSSKTSTKSSSAFIKGTSIEDSGESLSSSTGQTPSASASPTEVGVAPDQFNEQKKRRKTKRKKSVDTSSSSSSSIVLFTYSDDGHNPAGRDARTLSRHYRSAQAQKRRKNHRNKNRKRNLCQRHAMFVDFQDVGWNDWIVAPPGYAAYYCSGECPFPMAEHLNATNHAVIQALVHSMNPALVPPPCCVPTKYSSLSLLYTDSSDKIVLKNYNEMVVDSCGCS